MVTAYNTIFSSCRTHLICHPWLRHGDGEGKIVRGDEGTSWLSYDAKA